MGIYRFYRDLSERYPLINEHIRSDQIPEFDCMYLDMNGIIHGCSHGNEGECKFNTLDDLWTSISQYIFHLVRIIRPSQLLYMAVDGIAPRAKVNQQRTRRFRAVKDAENPTYSLEEEAEGLKIPVDSGSHQKFDSNCITPGSDFMRLLNVHLQSFVDAQLKSDPLWKSIGKIILSGPDVPGEGEHKIMSYIRNAKSQPDYYPNLRHCIYGMDADLIMLSLASHEPHFALLREKILFGRRKSPSINERKCFSKQMTTFDHFQLLHISLLREYLIIDLLSLPPIIVNGPLKHEQLSNQLTAEKHYDYQSSSIPATKSNKHHFTDGERAIDDFILLCSFIGSDFLPHLKFSDMHAGGITVLIKYYRKYRKLVQAYDKPDDEPWLTRNCGEVNWQNVYSFLQLWADHEDSCILGELEDLHWLKSRKPLNERHEHNDFLMGGRKAAVGESRNKETRGGEPEALYPFPTSELLNEVPTTEVGFRDVYYLDKMNMDINTPEGIAERNQLFQTYLEGIQWVLFYYYRGTPSWSWFFPFNYPPYIRDLLDYEVFSSNTLNIRFDLSRPFSPHEQLMALLPCQSAALVPTVYRSLMFTPSPIADFYPSTFEIDMDGSKVPWGGVCIIPLIDTNRLFSAMKEAVRSATAKSDTSPFTEEELQCNSEGTAFIYTRE